MTTTAALADRLPRMDLVEDGGSGLVVHDAELAVARAAYVAARDGLIEALTVRIGDAVRLGHPTAAQVGFVTDTSHPPQLTRIDVADDGEDFLGAVTVTHPDFAVLQQLHAELVELTGDVEAELDLEVAG